MYHFFTTLRFRLILLVSLAVLPALGVILYSGLEQRRMAAYEAKKDLLDMTHHASSYQERVVEGVRQLLFTLAQLPAVQQQDGPVCSAIFANLVEKQKIFGNISAVDRQGKVYATGRLQPGQAPSDAGRSHFERALKTQDFAIGEFGIGRTSGKATLHFAYPVIDHGVVQGVVSASVILDYLNTLVARTQMSAGSMLTVIDRDGTILARHPQPEQWVGKRMPEAEIIKIVLAKEEGIAQAVGIDGVPCLFAFTPLEVGSHDLFVYAGVPLKTVFAAANRTLTRNLLALGVAGLLALVAAWLLGQFFLINRTRTLVNQAQQFAGGDLRVRSGLSYNDGEFGQLAQSFDEMAATLQQRQESLRVSEEKYRTLVEQLPAIIYAMAPDEARTLLYVSPPAEALLGVSPAEYLADPAIWKNQVHPDDRDRVLAEIEASFATLTPIVDEIRMQSRSGDFLWFHTEARPVPAPSGRPLFLQGFMMDITARKEAEAALRRAEAALEERERFLSSIFDSIQDGISIIDPELNIVRVNRGKERDHAYAMPLVGKKCYEVFHEASEPCALCPVRRTLETGKADQEVVSAKLAGKAGVRYLNLRTFPLIDLASGKITGVVEYARDITEQVQSGEALRESEQRFRDIAENVAEWVWEVNCEGKLTYSSPVVEQLLGYKPEEVLGQHFYDFFLPDERERLKEAAFALFVTQKPFRDFPNRNLHKKGEIVWLSTSGVPVLDPQGNFLGYRGADIDITERRQAQEALEIANRQLQALVQEGEERNRAMARLNEMSDMLQTCQTSEEAFSAISHFVPQFFPTDAGALYLLRDSKNLLSSVTTWGPFPPSEELFLPEDCWAVRSGRAYQVADPARELRCKHISESDSLAAGYLCVPLMAQGVSQGLLHIRFLSCATQGREAAELDAKQRLAVAIAENLALALANLKLRETLQNQAIRDPLTGLFNRRYLEETMDRELHRSRRLKAHLGVVMMDLDHFKDFNDGFGHAAGDALLSALADVLTTGIRSEDIVCRYGGEEFLLIMPGAALPATQARAEEVRQAVQALQVKYQDRFLKSPTLSLGVAIFPDHGVTAEEVIAAADAALYRAKQAGRDRVEIAGLNSPEAAAP
jgi:diguanylate cyclase (GGDEF)-like protein/PAS domain S-box-containing protein